MVVGSDSVSATEGVPCPGEFAPQRWKQGGKRPACQAVRIVFSAVYAITEPEALKLSRRVELRDRWLRPPEWGRATGRAGPAHRKRPVPRDEDAAKALSQRTLTNLYNARPQWLADAHDALDAAVAAAYGWSADISDEDALRELLALNGGGR